METRTLRRSLIQRLFGICATPPPADPDCWTFQDRTVTVDIARIPELAKPTSAVRLERKGVADRFLLIHGDDGRYHAFKNRCMHGGRRLDPIPGAPHIQCCSIGRSTYDYSGKVLFGPAKRPLQVLPVRMEEGKAIFEA